MTTLLISKGNDEWHPVSNVIDVRVHPGKIVLENGQEVNGDIVAIIMDYDKFDAGQQTLRILAEMDHRIVDLRIVQDGGRATFDVSAIMCGDEVDPVSPKRYAILGRVMGIRGAGEAVSPSGRGGSVV